MSNKWVSLIPKNLLDSFSDGDPPVFFIGSGCGKEAVPPVKTASELAQSARTRLDIEDNGEGLAELLQYIKNDFAGSHAAVVKWLRTELAHDSAKPGCAHELLLRLPVNEYLTTNYDALLSKAAQESGITLVTVDDPGSFLITAKSSKTLGRLHGSFENAGAVVATTDDYIALFTSGDTRWRDLLLQLLRSRTVVFIGYSLRDFTTWTSYISTRIVWAKEMPPHVLVAPAVGSHMATFWRGLGIQYVPLTAARFLVGLHIALGSFPTDESVAIAAFGATKGLTAGVARTSLEEFRRRNHDPNLGVAAARHISEVSR